MDIADDLNNNVT